MSDMFKEKLASYEKGELAGEELVEFEEELAKLEQYQEYLAEKEPQHQINKVKQQKILRRSKWKARFQTAMTALGIIIIFTIVSTVLMGIYYSWGNPDRVDVLTDVVDHTLAITDPYGYMGGTSSNAKLFFRMDMTRDINKTVGKESIRVGELHIPFFFSFMGFPERNMDASQRWVAFTFPGSGDRGMSDWDRLENLPEGTVVSAYVSFTELIETSEVFQQFEGKDMDISWFAVDTGVEGTDNDHGVVFDPIGFSDYPIWHDDDMIQDSYEEEKGFLFSKVVSEGYSSPSYEQGDTDVLHKQFLKTLEFLEKHENKAEKLYSGRKLNLKERLEFLEENGIKHYGIVVTGPTKEILKLKDEEVISAIEIDEVGFWNW